MGPVPDAVVWMCNLAENEIGKSGEWSDSLIPDDLDSCSPYHTFSRSMDCFGKLGRGRISASPDQERGGGNSLRASELNWEKESVVEECRAVVEAVDRNLKALDPSVNYLNPLLASTADVIEEYLVSKKSVPPFVVMAQLRDRVQSFLGRGLATRRDKQGLVPSLATSSSVDVGTLDSGSVNEGKDSSLEAVNSLSNGASTSGLGKDGQDQSQSLGASQQLRSSKETFDCQAHALDEELEQVKDKLLLRSGPILIAVHGREGLGKTSLAALVCCNEAVIDRFLGGIYWVSLGRFPDLVGLQNKLLEDITGIRGDFHTIEDGIARLSQELASRLPSLLVIDDVWTVEDLNAFSLYEESLRGKYLVTLLDSTLLEGADKDDFSLCPRSEQQAATLFSSLLKSSKSKDIAEMSKRAQACEGVPLLVYSLSTSFCEERHPSMWERLSKMVADDVVRDATRVDEPRTQSPDSRAGSISPTLKPADVLQERIAPCNPVNVLPPEEERPLDENHPAERNPAHPLQGMEQARLQEGEGFSTHKTQHQHRTALSSSEDSSTDKCTAKTGITTYRKTPNDHRQSEDRLEARDSSATSQDLLPLLLCFDSLSAIHPVLLDRYLDLSAFPKGEYICSERIENVWGNGRILNHSYTLVVLGLFASRSLVEWRFESTPVQASFRKTGYSLHWRLPSVFHDFARLVIGVNNERLVKLRSNPETVKGWSARETSPEIQDLASEKSADAPRLAGSSLQSCVTCGLNGIDFNCEDMFEKIRHVKVRGPGSTEPYQATLSDNKQDAGWSVSAGTVADFPGENGKGTACLDRLSHFCSLRCRLFSPELLRDQFPLDWTFGPISTTAEKLSLDRAAVSQLPESLSFPSLRTAMLGNNLVLKQLPSYTCARMPSLLVLELNGCSAVRTIPKTISSLQSLKVLNLSGCTYLQVLPTSIGQLTSLRELRAAKCVSLGCLPQSACSLTNLEVLDLSSCFKLRYLPSNLGQLSSLRYLHLKNCQLLRSIPKSISLLTKILQIDMTGCFSLEYTPSYLNQLRLLANSQKVGPMAVPPGLWKLPNLEVLQLCAATHVTILPSAIAGLKRIRHLNFAGCRNLEYLPEDIGSLNLLEDLNLSCTALRKLPSSLSGLRNLKTLSIRECPRLLSLPSTIASLPSLKSLDVSYCWDLIVIPPSVGEPNSFKKLYQLDMAGCSFQSLPAFSVGACPALKNLNLSDCVNLTSLPSTIRFVKSLEVLNLDGCRNLQSLEDLGLEDLTNLSHLSLRNCTAMTTLPGQQLVQLKYLDVSGCPVSPFPEALRAQARDGKLRLVRWGAIWHE